MPDLAFRVLDVSATKFAAAPCLSLRVQLDAQPSDAPIHSVLLQTQVRIEAPARTYSGVEAAGLHELFGPRSEWGRSLRSFLWCHVSTTVRGFTHTTVAELQLPCTYDFAAMAAKYFHSLEGGDAPLLLLFSGTIFYAGDEGLQIVQLPWTSETRFVLPVAEWQRTLEHYYPNGAPLTVRRDLFDRLYRFQVREGLPSFDHALERLLAGRS